MSATTTSRPTRPDPARPGAGVRALWSGNPGSIINRELIAARSTNWAVLASGIAEPIFYLLALGIGIGGYVGDIVAADGSPIPYAAYIAPALLAVAAMNGALYDSTWNVFFKLHVQRHYEAMLATPLGPLDVAVGQISWSLLRGGVYGLAFLGVMQVLGLNLAWTALLALPAILLVAFGFASFGMGLTSYLKSFQQMDWIFFVVLPMFLLSATFFPITVYPEPVQWVVMALPLWHGVELVRGLTTGHLDAGMLGHVAYYLVMAALGLTFATRRLKALFLS
ncbi:MAG: ABC transporter permease [Actinomycetales bacterium]|nr:ABC transporter permease [Actinomycetales bacterium]